MPVAFGQYEYSIQPPSVTIKVFCYPGECTFTLYGPVEATNERNELPKIC